MNYVHLYDDKGVKSCSKKPPNIRSYNLSKVKILSITCKKCRFILEKDYFSKEFD
jgi:hypothetical protein